MDLNPPEIQQYIPISKNNESMLPSRPNFVTKINIFGEIQTAHKNLGFPCTSSKGQIPRFHTSKFVQGLKADLDEHKRTATMFQKVAEYNVQMTNILFRLFDLEISCLQKV